MTNEVQEQPAATEAVVVKVYPIESRFLFVDVAALRAKQLRRGARVRLPGAVDAQGEPSADMPRKPERIAMEEVRQGLVAWDLPGPAKVEEEGQ